MDIKVEYSGKVGRYHHRGNIDVSNSVASVERFALNKIEKVGKTSILLYHCSWVQKVEPYFGSFSLTKIA
jgi:hypothetical protein